MSGDFMDLFADQRPKTSFTPGANLPSEWSQFYKTAIDRVNQDPGGMGNWYDEHNQPYYDPVTKYLTVPDPGNPHSGTFRVIPDAEAYLGPREAKGQAFNGKPAYWYDSGGNFLKQTTEANWGEGHMNPLAGALGILALPFAASAAGIGGAGSAATGATGAAATGATTAPVLGATGALTGTPLLPAAAGGGLAGGLGSLFGGGSIFSKVGSAVAGKVLPSLFGGGGSGGGGMNLSDIFNVGAGIYGSQQQGQAATKFMDWMNNQQNYVRNYGTEGTPEFDYLKRTLEAKDAAAGRNSQYGPRTADLLGQLGQAKLDATSRMALGFANPYQKALNQDANKYAGLPAAINKLLGGQGLVTPQNISSILNGLGGSGLSTSDFLDKVGADGGLPPGIDYDPTQMPTEDDILPFLDFFGQEDWLGF